MCHLAAVRGYGPSAATLAASIYEGFFYITAIVNNEDKAREWIEYGIDDDLSYEIVKSSVLKLDQCRKEFFLKKWGEESEGYKEEFKGARIAYANLCAMKHLNPAMMRRQGYKITKSQGISTAHLSPIPFLETSLFPCAYAIVQASQYLIFSAQYYAESHTKKAKEEISARRDAEIDFLKETYTEFMKMHNIEFVSQ